MDRNRIEHAIHAPGTTGQHCRKGTLEAALDRRASFGQSRDEREPTL